MAVSSQTPSQYVLNEHDLLRWTKQTIESQPWAEKGVAIEHWSALSGDAGFRRYFRFSCASTSLLAVFAPPDTENNRGFISIDQNLFEQGVHVPKILAHDLKQGYFLIEDFGEALYYDHLNNDTANTLYGEALIALLRIQQCRQDYAVFPEYSRDKLVNEMVLFPEWFVEQLLDYGIQDSDLAILENVIGQLADCASEQPKVIVHRDFHSRNLVYGVGGTPGIIDFQDAVIGPITYDLVSLLRDCYVEWPAEQVHRWALAYANMAIDAGVMPPVSEQVFMQWFDFMGLQRHLKVLGIFARLSLRDGKHGYLKDLPLVIRYIRQVCARYESLGEFAQWFDSVLLPLIEQQDWMDS